MIPPAPHLVIVAGPNGAGKSTSARFLLPENIVFLNADEIAAQLTDEPGRDMHAGRLLFERWDHLAANRTSFAVEATLSSQTLVRRVVALKSAGYLVSLVFFWLPSADAAVDRVAERMRHGGHSIPEETIRRRYDFGLRNLVALYLPLADAWKIYDNSALADPVIICEGMGAQVLAVHKEDPWNQILKNQRV